jgi:hypothetical protein
VTQADLNFMRPLFDLAGSLTDDEDIEDMSMGLGEIHPDSDLAGDDNDLDGMWVSMVVNNAILASLDHVITLRDLVTRDRGTVTINAPWTLMRAVVESASVAVWVATPTLRKTRRAHALRVWHHDYSERQNWETDIGRVVSEKGKSGKERASDIVRLAERLGIRGTQVSAAIAYSDVVANAGALVGWEREDARARWREASAFAHGKTWPLLALTTPRGATAIRGGVGMHLTLDESKLGPVTTLAHRLLDVALIRYAELADQPARAPDLPVV